MFGIGTPAERTKDGAIISSTETWFIVVLGLALLVAGSQIFTVLVDTARMERNGVLVDGTVLSNRFEGSGDDIQTYAMVAFTPKPMQSKPQGEVRAELYDEGAYQEGSVMTVLYDPSDLSLVKLPFGAGYWLVLIGIGLGWFAGVMLVWVNLVRRMRGEIVFLRTPDTVDYTPTAAEDAEYDRNKAAGISMVMANVDGKWVRLKGKALEDSEKEDRKAMRIFMAVGLFSMAAAIGLLVFLMDWFALVFAFILFILGAAFFYAGYSAMRQEKK